MMISRKLLVGLILVCTCLVNVDTAGAQTDADGQDQGSPTTPISPTAASPAVIAATTDISRLENLLQAIQTLSADVVQLIVESDGGVLEESEIHMYLKKPNGFYWETLSPFPELVVINDDTLWNYVPDLEQVVVEDWDWESDRSELAAQLLSGRTENLSAEYRVMLVSSTDSEYQEFELTPLANDSIYKQISINFLASELDMIYLDAKNGQQTVWQFKNAVRNQPLEDSMFEFQPPDGIEVIKNNYTR